MRCSAGRISLIVLIACLLATPNLQATGPEAAWGTYWYSGKGLKIEIVWTEEGIQKATVNGRNYPNASAPEYGNFGSEGVYPFGFTLELTDTTYKHLGLLLLFDRGKLVRVAVQPLLSVGDSHHRQQVSRALPGFDVRHAQMQLERFRNLRANRQHDFTIGVQFSNAAG